MNEEREGGDEPEPTGYLKSRVMTEILMKHDEELEGLRDYHID